jgi:hypothetical protein
VLKRIAAGSEIEYCIATTAGTPARLRAIPIAPYGAIVGDPDTWAVRQALSTTSRT